jgi:hypothetical protein
MNSKKLFAVFSAKQKEEAGSHIYRRSDGSEVEVTCVSWEKGSPETKWEDKVDLGEVEVWVRAEKEVEGMFRHATKHIRDNEQPNFFHYDQGRLYKTSLSL